MRQWLIAFTLGGVFILLLGLPFLLLPKGVYWLLAAILWLPLISVLESLLLTPLYALIRRFTYYSPLLLATASPQGLDLHVGTLYDYVTHLRWRDRGARAQRQVVRYMLQGLMAICDAVAEGRLSAHTEITATSYFFSNSSVEKLGFVAGKAFSGQKLNLLMEFLSLTLRLSFIRGRWCWPDLKQSKSIQTTAGELLLHRPVIVKMLVRMQRGDTTKGQERAVT